MPPPQICLSMIVKDEAPVIQRCLESVAPLITHWVVVDTGSSDDTRDIVRSFFASRNIPGTLYDRPWRDFATNRTEALDYARPHGAYSLIIDADDTIEMLDGFEWPDMTADAYSIKVVDQTISFARPHLVHSTLPWSYKGVVHEFLTCEGAAPAQILHGLVMHRNYDGARRRDPLVYAKDASLLESALLTETNPMLRGRYTYYLGQSYRDAEQPAKAAEAYGRRSEMGGWEEERWSAILYRARCLLAAGDEAGFAKYATEAFTARQHRAEPLCDLARFSRNHQEYEKAMKLAKMGATIPWPTQDRLFVEDFVYHFGIRQELSIAGFFCSDPSDRELGRIATSQLALDRRAPEDIRSHARRNLSFYSRPVWTMMPSWTAQQIRWTPPDGWRAMNPSIAQIGGSLMTTVRTVNFDTPNGIDYVVPDGGPIRTRNFLLSLDESLSPVQATEVLVPTDLPEPQFQKVRGFEDLRLFEWDDDLWCTAAVVEMRGWYEIVLARIDNRGTSEAALLDWRVLSTSGDQRHEKNWMPRLNSGRLEFIYSSDPVRIVDDLSRPIGQTQPDAALDHLRGGSQVIPFDDGWLAVVHEVSLIEGRRSYLHRFAWYDSSDNLRRLSEAFFFNDPGLEFAAGLCPHTDGERLIISFGARDREAWLATVVIDDVRTALSIGW